LAENKKSFRKGSSGTSSEVKIDDPRAPFPPTEANLAATLEELRAVLGQLPKPGEPGHQELVDVVLHIIFADGLPCALGQAALRRIEDSFVDRNEFRVTEAYEIAELLGDLGIPDLFSRCTVARAAVGEIYNDQNEVSLELLRDATVAERNSFFARVPAVPSRGIRFLVNHLSFTELLFSDRSTLRVQQRLGLDAQIDPAKDFVAELRQLFQPFGHIPIVVAPSGDGSDSGSAPNLCPTCLLVRLVQKK
jgi:hypothetical protein